MDRDMDRLKDQLAQLAAPDRIQYLIGIEKIEKFLNGLGIQVEVKVDIDGASICYKEHRVWWKSKDTWKYQWYRDLKTSELQLCHHYLPELLEEIIKRMK